MVKLGNIKDKAQKKLIENQIAKSGYQFYLMGYLDAERKADKLKWGQFKKEFKEIIKKGKELREKD